MQTRWWVDSRQYGSRQIFRLKCDFAGVSRVAGTGAGSGHLVIAFQKYPALKGVLMDVLELIPVAKARNPPPSSVASRLEYRGGDMFWSAPVNGAWMAAAGSVRRPSRNDVC